ncbi:14573_t:CDS:2 [Funneliformis geosporum]|nr:14573_t:CDS:2 [Funneliformis geosporum]
MFSKENKNLEIIPFLQTRHTLSLIFKALFICIVIWNVSNYLFYIKEQNETVDNIGGNELVPTLDTTLINDNAEAEDVKIAHDIEINKKYCGSAECKFLFAHYITEQESQANSHFYSFIQLAEMLNRTIVLVNVQNSRLGSCQNLPFSFYYNVEAIKALFPRVNFITQQDFLNWTKQLYRKPDTIFRYIEQDGIPNTSRTITIDLDVLLKDECLEQFDLNFKKDDSIVKMLYIGLRSYWTTQMSNLVIIDYLTKHLDLNEPVILIRHELRYPLFPSKGPIIPLPYANHLMEAANKVKERLSKFIGIHWRMESAKPEMMPACAKGLIKYIEKMKTTSNIKNVFFATDYPLTNLRSAFTLNTWVSMRSLDYLYEEFPEYRKEIDQEFDESGVQGILDKLVLIGGDYFVSGPRQCARILSNFTKRISEERHRLINGGNKKIHLNIFDHAQRQGKLCPQIEDPPKGNTSLLKMTNAPLEQLDNNDMIQILFTCDEKNKPVLCKKAKTAFQNVANLVSDTIDFKVPIIINASFTKICGSFINCDPTKPGPLGAAGPSRLIPLKDDDEKTRLYPQALVKQFKLEKHPEYSEVDIQAGFNSEISTFWFRGDPEIGKDQVDFELVLAHEFLHGLGFLSSWDEYLNFDTPIGLSPFPSFLITTDDLSSSNIGPITFTGFQEFPFDRYLSLTKDNIPLSSIADKINQFANSTTTFANEQEFTNAFTNSSQYLECKQMLQNSITKDSIVFKLSDNDLYTIETSLVPYKQGSTLKHGDFDTFSNSTDFLMRWRSPRQVTMENLLSINGNVSDYTNPIGPKTLKVLEALGYTIKNNPNEQTANDVKQGDNNLQSTSGTESKSTHSSTLLLGFHNQRVSMENAFFMAYFLNRTLILPPIIFLDGISHIYSENTDKLYSGLIPLNRNSNNFKFCKNNQCKDIQYTLYPWEELFDMRWIRERIKIIHRSDFNLSSLLNSLSITNEKEFLFLKDKHIYQHKFYDDSDSKIPLNKYHMRINLSNLKEDHNNKKLIHFGSLFSALRIVKELPESKIFWKNLTRELVPNNQIMIEITRNIINELGGKGNFIGVHFRLGDSFFKNHRNVTLDKMTQRIINDYIKNSVPNHQSDKLFNLCKNDLIKPNTVPLVVFLASDKDKSDPTLQSFLEIFPCTFMQSDFNYLLEPLKKVINPLDNMNMYKFLLPFVDLLTVSHGVKFYGTEKSTFSSYAQRLHDLY